MSPSTFVRLDPASRPERPAFLAFARLLVLGVLSVSVLSAGHLGATQLSSSFEPFVSSGQTAGIARGVWTIPGYGRVLLVEPKSVQLFHTVGDVCLRDPMESEDLMAYIGFARRVGPNLEIASTRRSAPYLARPRSELPEGCAAVAEGADPVFVFDVFAEIMRAHYAFFDLHGVDWEERVRASRPRVTATMSDAELFDLLGEMLEGLDDGHTSLEGMVDGEERRASGVKPSALRQALDDQFTRQKKFKTARELRQAWIRSYFRNVRKKLLAKPQSRLNDAVVWGKVKGTNVGYVNIFQMSGYSPTGLPADGQTAVGEIMEEALRDLDGVDHVIVDVSFNQGGADEISSTFAGHFAPEDDLPVAYTKRPYREEAPEFVRSLRVVPADGRRYAGPVSLVTTEQTVSAGETFVMYMRSLPNVTHVGQPTAGALSDILDKPLPNGWTLGLSNEIYLDPDGALWEGPGIPPQKLLEIFDPSEDIFESHWKAIRRLATVVGNTSAGAR